MDITEIIERLKNIAGHAVHTVCERQFVMSLDDGIAVHEAIELLEKAETVEAIPVDYLNSCIDDFRQRESYAGRFAADLLEAIIKDYNKEAHND